MTSALEPIRSLLSRVSAAKVRCCKETKPASLSPAGEVVRSTIWHPAPLAICVDVAVNNLRIDVGRVEGHERGKCSELSRNVRRVLTSQIFANSYRVPTI